MKTLKNKMTKQHILVFMVMIVFLPQLSSARDCESFENSFNYRYSLSIISNHCVLAKNKINAKDKDSQVSIHEYFNWPADRHSTTKYQLISIENEKIEIKYDYSSDTRGIGGRVENCHGVFINDLSYSGQSKN